MRLDQIITRDSVITGVEAVGKEEALIKLCQTIAGLNSWPADEITRVVLTREKMGSTGFGGGVAIPHGKSPEIKHFSLLIARMKNGLDFDSADGQPVHLLALFLGPDGAAEDHIKILARLGRFFKNPANVHAALGAADAQELYNIVVLNDRE